MASAWELMMIQRLFETGYHVEVIAPPEFYRDRALELAGKLNAGKINTRAYCREMMRLIELYNRNLLLQ